LARADQTKQPALVFGLLELLEQLVHVFIQAFKPSHILRIVGLCWLRLCLGEGVRLLVFVSIYLLDSARSHAINLSHELLVLLSDQYDVLFDALVTTFTKLLAPSRVLDRTSLCRVLLALFRVTKVYLFVQGIDCQLDLIVDFAIFDEFTKDFARLQKQVF
jgi:hypothetical protein